MVARSIEPSSMSGSLPQVFAMGVMHRQTLKSHEVVQNSNGSLSLRNGSSLEQLRSDYSFFHIVEMQGLSVTKYFNNQNKRQLSPLNIYDFGLKLLDFLEMVHSAGYAYNDLTLDKIHLGQKQQLQ